MAKINTRSPYHINVSSAGMTTAKLEIYIYTGTQVTDRGSINHTITSTAYEAELTFEISELVNDFLTTTFNGTHIGQNVFVDYQITTYIGATPTVLTLVALEGFNGYGYFNDGVNPQLTSNAYISNASIYAPLASAVTIPVNQDTVTDVVFNKGGVLVSTTTIIATTESDEVIRYATGTDIDEIILKDGLTTLQTIVVHNIEECKFTPYKLTFVNKFGALQDLWFFKRTDKSLSTKDEKYKSNILSSGTYSINEHQSTILNKQGKETLTLNSGYYEENHNEVFAQLSLSEKVWITYKSQVLPISITSSSLAFKTQLSDKLINYTIGCEFAFDKINNIR